MIQFRPLGSEALNSCVFTEELAVFLVQVFDIYSDHGGIVLVN
jgi:hypothetical protein